MSYKGSGFTYKLKTKVSGDKNRFIDGDFNLDLTYITDRIIAMSFPAEGVEATYRNSILEVVKMLDSYHSNHYLIFNLSQRPYDFEKFHYQVKSIGWEDHTAPPLHILWEICISIDKYLAEDPKNVVIVHCLAGKGRTGLIIAAYFLYCNLFDNAEAAMLYFAYKRSSNNWGVAVPSQRRYVQYMERLLNGNFAETQTLLLSAIQLSCIPPFDTAKGGSNIGIEIKYLTNADRPLTLLSLPNVHKPIKMEKESFPVNQFIRGDIQIIIKHQGTIRTSIIAKIQFHTGMVESQTVIFNKRNLDDSFKDFRLPDNFEIALIFEEYNESSELFVKFKKSLSKKNSSFPEIDLSRTSVKRDGSLPFYYSSEEELNQKRSDTNNISTGNLSTEKGGWVEKQGDTLKLWKHRWLSLKSDTICYYKDPKRVNPVGVIKLREIVQVISDLKSCTFEIETTERVHRLKARDDQDCCDWVESIEYAREFNCLNGSEPEEINLRGSNNILSEDDFVNVDNNTNIIPNMVPSDSSEWILM